MEISATLNLLLVMLHSSTLMAATLPIPSPKWRTSQLLQDTEVYVPTSSSNAAANYLDALPNTVGLLLMNNQVEGVHIWLPIGKRVFVHESPIIPAVPLTARITSMVAATHARAIVKALDRIMCRVYPRGGAHLSEQGDKMPLMAGRSGVAFSKQDGLVRLVARRGLLEAQEAESYECVRREQVSHDEPASRKGFLDGVAAWFEWWFVSRGLPHMAL